MKIKLGQGGLWHYDVVLFMSCRHMRSQIVSPRSMVIRRPSSVAGWMLAALLLLALLFNSAIPRGFMPGAVAKRAHIETFLVLCSSGGLRLAAHDASLLAELAGDTQGGSVSSSCPYGLLQQPHAGAQGRPGLSPILAVGILPWRDAARLPAGAVFVAGAPLGPRAPPLIS